MELNLEINWRSCLVRSRKNNSIWVYQFWFNTADSDVISAIKKFTFLEREEIEKLEESVEKEPHLRLAQKALAEELVKIVHGEKALESALKHYKSIILRKR